MAIHKKWMNIHTLGEETLSSFHSLQHTATPTTTHCNTIHAYLLKETRQGTIRVMEDSWMIHTAHHTVTLHSVLQCVAVCCSVLQCVAVRKTLQCLYWHTLCNGTRCTIRVIEDQCVAVCCSVLQCVAVCCSENDSMAPDAQSVW